MGNKVTYLKRIKIGKLELGNLQIGKYRELTEKEKQMVFMELEFKAFLSTSACSYNVETIVHINYSTSKHT